MVKNLATNAGIRSDGQALGQEDPLEEGMATHFSLLAWRILRTEEPGGLQSTGLQSWTRLSALGFPSQRTGSRFFLRRICTTPPPHLFPTSVPESWVQPLPFSSIPGTPGAGSLHLLPPAQLPGYAPARPSVPAGLCSNARLQLTSPAHPQIHLPFHLLASHTCRHILSASWRLREGQGFVFCPLL